MPWPLLFRLCCVFLAFTESDQPQAADQDPGRIRDHFLVCPALLAAWIGLRLTKPIKDPCLKVTVGVLIGAAIAFFSTYVIRVVLLLAVLPRRRYHWFAGRDPLRLKEGQVGDLQRKKFQPAGGVMATEDEQQVWCKDCNCYLYSNDRLPGKMHRAHVGPSACL
jgi:hypothetical protein